MWTADEAWRAPLGDFPPPWASAWGDDPYGLWADLTVNGVTQRLRWIEPSGPEGFLMGSHQVDRDAIKDKDLRDWADRSESDPQKVVIDNGFWLADTPCTQGFWQAVMGYNPSSFKDQSDSALRPVEQVTWGDVERFVLRFAATPEWCCEDRLGLPTEAQWEYAARAGGTEAYWWGDGVNSALANWNREQGGTSLVKRYAANPWGLFDVHGNVCEWCDDPWRQLLDVPEREPESAFHVVRGGSWHHQSEVARSAFRFKRPNGDVAENQGFRIVLRFCSHQSAKSGQPTGYKHLQ